PPSPRKRTRSRWPPTSPTKPPRTRSRSCASDSNRPEPIYFTEGNGGNEGKDLPTEHTEGHGMVWGFSSVLFRVFRGQIPAFVSSVTFVAFCKPDFCLVRILS